MNKIPLPNIFLYEFEIDINLINDALSKLLENKQIKRIPADPTIQNTSYAIYPIDSDSKIVPIFHEQLFIKLQECVDEVVSIHFKENIKLCICDSWLTKAEFGMRGNWHTHQLSFLSGLLYLSDHEKSETHFTVKDDFYEKNSHMFKTIMNENEYIYKIKPRKGTLLIWDSNTPHKMSPHTGKTTRYTLAFNTFLTGNIGIPTASISLHCNDVKDLSNKY